MKKATLLRIVFVLVAMVALGLLPQPVLAQHGGHGGGGGFHSGGGAFHGGGGGGGFHRGGSFYAGGHSGCRRRTLPTADIVVVTMEDGAITEVAAVMAGATAGAEDIGAQDTVTGGVGGLASGGRIGVRGYPYGYYYSPWYSPAYLFLPVPFGSQQRGRRSSAGRSQHTVPAQPEGSHQILGILHPGEDVANTNYATSNVVAPAPRRPVVSVDRIVVTPSSYRPHVQSQEIVHQGVDRPATG